MPKQNSFSRAITISLPEKGIVTQFVNELRKLQSHLHFSVEFPDLTPPSPRNFSRSVRSFRKPNLPKTKWIAGIVGALAIVIGASLLVRGLYSTSQVKGITQTGSDNLQVAPALKSQEINQEYSFPLLDAANNEVSSIKYLITKAELRREIIVAGKRAKAVEGRAFLVLTLKITNNFNQPIEIDTRDYLRLVVNNKEEEKLAPEIHNDPVEVQAISVKYTRIGFTINETDSPLVLQIGEISQDKQTLELNLN